MKIYAEREGNVECGHATFDPLRGLRVTIRVLDGETLVEYDALAEPLIVCEGMPLTLKVYEIP